MKYDEEDSLYYARHLKYKAMEEGWGITEMMFEVPEKMFNPEKTTMYGIKAIKGRDDIPRLYVGYSPNGAKVVLTIAHLDHTPENCDYNNLKALCQKCHNTYDAKHRAETRRKGAKE